MFLRGGFVSLFQSLPSDAAVVALQNHDGNNRGVWSDVSRDVGQLSVSTNIKEKCENHGHGKTFHRGYSQNGAFWVKFHSQQLAGMLQVYDDTLLKITCPHNMATATTM